jgi:sulfate adenylyltransferase
MNNSLLNPPYGGELVDLIVQAEHLDQLKEYAGRLPSVQISERSLCDLQLLASGAFSPLDRFVSQSDHQRILDEMRLTSGHLFPIPVTLPVNPIPGLRLDHDLALRSSKNELLAILTVEEIYEWDVSETARKVFNTEDSKHPLVSEMQRWGKLNISGRLQVLQIPRSYDFQDLRLTAAEVRTRLGHMGRPNVVAFQTRNPLHRAHEELTKRAMEQVDGVLLLHPVVGLTKPGDVDHFTRVRTYRILAERYYDQERILLALLPLAMRMAGPREALWHALIRRNYGANHLIVGRDHASPGTDSRNRAFYGPYDAQHLVEQFSEELGVGVLPFQELVYLADGDRYEEASKAVKGITLSGTQVREEYLNQGRELPKWFTRPEVAQILKDAYPARNQQGVCVWFTGLSGAGKSTTAEILTELLLENGRQTTLLDGDIVRTNLSKGLGFSKEDRDINIRRIGFVASELVRHGGLAICAVVSPYRATRNAVRNMVGADRFIEVFVDTPLDVCEQRDTKGIYAQARRGEIKHFTGIDDPYETPLNPEITLNTVSQSAEENARLILRSLFEQGFVELARTSDKSIPLPPQQYIDLVGGGDYYQVGRDVLDLVRRRCRLQPTDRILDLGSGCGRLAVPLTQYLRAEGDYDGLDIVLPMVEWCRDNISPKFPNFRFHHASLKNTYYSESGADAKDYSFPFSDLTFNVVVAASVFTHLLPPSAAQYAAEVARVLRNDGRALLSFFLRTDDRENNYAHVCKHRYADYSVTHDDDPEAFIALDERWVLSTLRSVGLSVDDISYGSWNSHRGEGFQDVIVVTRNS